MGPIQHALTSLVAAIPACFLSYLLVMAFLSRADSLSMMMKVVAGMTLLSSVLVALMPVGVIVLGNRKPKVDEEDVAEAEAVDATVGSDDDEVVETLDGDDDGEESLDTFSESDDVADDFGETEGDVLSDSSGDFDVETGSSLDDIDAVDFGDEEEEEPKPKKRKK